MRRFGGERVKSFMDRMGMDEDLPLAHSWLSKTVEQAQTRVEGYNFDIRKHVLEYDDVVNKQREVIYQQRRQILESDDLRGIALRMAGERVQELVHAHTTALGYDEWDLASLFGALRSFFPFPPDFGPSAWEGMEPEQIIEQLEGMAATTLDGIAQQLGQNVFRQNVQEGASLQSLQAHGSPFQRLIYQRAAQLLDGAIKPDLAGQRLGNLPRDMREAVEKGTIEATATYRLRDIMLRAVDKLWIRHLTDLDVLREGIGLRAYGQQNPLVAFKKEGHEMYMRLLGSIQEEIVGGLFRVPVAAAQQQALPLQARPRRQLVTNRQEGDDGRSRPVRASDKDRLGRNDPCWCNSGKKYKHCHWKQDRAGRATAGGRPPQRPARRRKRKR
jgi:preprotein translocase subunit SecA